MLNFSFLFLNTLTSASTKGNYTTFNVWIIYPKKANWFSFCVHISKKSVIIQFFFYCYYYFKGIWLFSEWNSTKLHTWDTRNRNFCWTNYWKWRDCIISINIMHFSEENSVGYNLHIFYSCLHIKNIRGSLSL